MASNSTSTATVSEGGIPTLLLRGDAAQHQADLIHGHEARAQQQQQQRSTTARPDGLRNDREYHEAWTGGDPEGWPQARGVPPFRPLRSNEASTRPLGASTPERVFVTAMFTGVYANHVMHEVWANSVGRFTKKTFVYPIGGQF